MGRDLRRGDVCWYRFPHPDKRRPVLVLTRQSALAFLSDVTVAPVTSRIRDIPTEVVLDRDDGMPRRCAVNCDHLRTVPRARIGARLSRLPAARMAEVADAVGFALGLD